MLHVLLLHSFQWLNEQFDRGNVMLNQPEEGALHPQIQPVARLKMCSQQVHRANVHCIFLYIWPATQIRQTAPTYSHPSAFLAEQHGDPQQEHA